MTSTTESTGSNRRSSRWAGYIGLAWLVVSALATYVPAADDDWEFGTPILHPSWSELLSQDNAWRPVERLFRMVAGLAPSMFPFLNHVVVAIAHGGCACLVGWLLKRLNVREPVRATAALLFLLSPATSATVFSVDSVNQAWSLFFGLCSVAVLVTGQRWIHTAGWVGLALLSTLAKESGIAFFVVGPLLATALDDRERDLTLTRWRPSRRFIVLASVGILSAALYLAGWVLLIGGSFAGPSAGKYKLQSSPLMWVRNMSWLLAFSSTPVDTLALFLKPTSPLRVVLSSAAAVPLLLTVAVAGWGSSARIGFVACLVSACIVSLPHVFIEHPGEMNAYPTVAMLCLCYALALSRTSRASARWLVPAVSLFLAVSVIVGFGKWRSMVAYGRSADVIARSIDGQTRSQKPRSVCIIRSGRVESIGYSVYQQSPERASGWGRAVLPLWNWSRPEKFIDCGNVSECSGGCDATWTFSGHGRVRVDPVPPP